MEVNVDGKAQKMSQRDCKIWQKKGKMQKKEINFFIFFYYFMLMEIV